MINNNIYCYVGASLLAQTVKNLSAMQETQVWPLAWEDLLEKGMAMHSSILAWRIPWTKEPGGLHPWGRKESDKIEQLTLSLLGYVITHILMGWNDITYITEQPASWHCWEGFVRESQQSALHSGWQWERIHSLWWCFHCEYSHWKSH